MAASLKVVIDVDDKGRVKIKNFGHDLDKLSLKADGLGAKFSSAAKGVGKIGIAAGAAATAVGAAAASFGAFKLAQFAKDVVETNMAFETLDLSLAAAAGSAEAGADAQKYLREESERLGLVFQDNVKYFTLMTAAAKGTALEGQAVRDVWLSIVEAGKVVGASNEELSRTFLQLQQGIGKGKFELVDLKMIMEALPGVGLQDFANAMDVTTAEFLKMVTEGKVLADVFLPRLVDVFKNKFGPAVKEASQTASSNINRIINYWTDFKKAIGDSGFYDVVKTGLKDIVENIKGLSSSGQLKQWAKEAGDALSDMATSAGDFAKYLIDNKDDIVGFFQDIGNRAKTMYEVASVPVKAFGGLVYDIADGAALFASNMIDAFNDAKKSISDFASAAANSLGEFKNSVSDGFVSATNDVRNWIEIIDTVPVTLESISDFEPPDTGKLIEPIKMFTKSVKESKGPLKEISEIQPLKKVTKDFDEGKWSVKEYDEYMDSLIENFWKARKSEVKTEFKGNVDGTETFFGVAMDEMRHSSREFEGLFGDETITVNWTNPDGRPLMEVMEEMGVLWGGVKTSMREKITIEINNDQALNALKDQLAMTKQLYEDSTRMADKYYQHTYGQQKSELETALKREINQRIIDSKHSFGPYGNPDMAGAQTVPNTIGSYAGGTGPRGLPMDGLYYGHRGEIVLNPQESNSYRTSNDNRKMNVTINVTGGNSQQTAREIKRELEQLERRW
jgi:tape measure domain-containing protein